MLIVQCIGLARKDFETDQDQDPPGRSTMLGQDWFSNQATDVVSTMAAAVLMLHCFNVSLPLIKVVDCNRVYCSPLLNVRQDGNSSSLE